MSHQRTPAPQRGFTAIELIIVLVIGFSIIAMSASKMGDLFESSKITRAVSNITELTTTVGAMEGHDGYGADNADLTPVLISSQMMPKTLKIRGDNAENEWNAPVIVTLINGGRGFSIQYPAVPKKACSKLAGSLLASEIFSGIHTGDRAQLINSGSTAQQILQACSAQNARTVNLTFEVNGAAGVPR